VDLYLGNFIEQSLRMHSWQISVWVEEIRFLVWAGGGYVKDKCTPHQWRHYISWNE